MHINALERKGFITDHLYDLSTKLCPEGQLCLFPITYAKQPCILVAVRSGEMIISLIDSEKIWHMSHMKSYWIPNAQAVNLPSSVLDHILHLSTMTKEKKLETLISTASRLNPNPYIL